jgi:hypothetical protein
MSIMACNNCGCPIDTDFEDECPECGAALWKDDEEWEDEEEPEDEGFVIVP